jgi:DNA-binding XRE family transcriptional regulator
MDSKEKKIEVMRQWAVETLQQERKSSSEGRATLNRKLRDFLDTCHEIGAAPPEELLALNARQLRVDCRIRNAPRRKMEQLAAAMAIAREPTVSDKKLAALCGVSRPTIARWRKEPWFESLKTTFELDGILKEVFTWQQKSPR